MDAWLSHQRGLMRPRKRLLLGQEMPVRQCYMAWGVLSIRYYVCMYQEMPEIKVLFGQNCHC